MWDTTLWSYKTGCRMHRVSYQTGFTVSVPLMICLFGVSRQISTFYFTISEKCLENFTGLISNFRTVMDFFLSYNHGVKVQTRNLLFWDGKWIDMANIMLIVCCTIIPIRPYKRTGSTSVRPRAVYLELSPLSASRHRELLRLFDHIALANVAAGSLHSRRICART